MGKKDKEIKEEIPYDEDKRKEIEDSKKKSSKASSSAPRSCATQSTMKTEPSTESRAPQTQEEKDALVDYVIQLMRNKYNKRKR
ncbi:hypothetical protein A2U01_0009923 [Trifolium medium]|uniref:Uncharacterized protein n=1 Tax=Trifolium medium TaxID=97028 RepID=A0A392MNE2_9FABA|nr:hypothetical protein [Trifolium medium]